VEVPILKQGAVAHCNFSGALSRTRPQHLPYGSRSASCQAFAPERLSSNVTAMEREWTRLRPRTCGRSALMIRLRARRRLS